MEIDGKKFAENIQIETQREKLMQEQQRLEALKKNPYTQTEQTRGANGSSKESLLDLSLNTASRPSENLEEPTIEDIQLQKEDAEVAKKRYILLGIALILVFVITILIIRLISNNDTEQKMENLNPQHSSLDTEKILNKIDTNEEYQQAVDDTLTKKQTQNNQTNSVPDLDMGEEQVNNTPLIIEKPKQKELQKDIFGLNKQQTTTQTKLQQTTTTKQHKATTKVQKQTKLSYSKKQETKPKKTIKALVQTLKKDSPAKVSGYYIQIGAYTKQPSATLLKTIKAKGFSYVVHKMVIKGTKYNKVLIGSYPTKQKAHKELSKVRKKLKKPSAYIVKF